MPTPETLTEAAAFTFGCMVLRQPWMDSHRAGLGLATVAATLSLVLVIALSPADFHLDPNALDPAQIWPAPR